MPIKQVQALLRARIGLDPSSIGSNALEAAVRARIADSGCQSASAYAERLLVHPAEVELLIEEVVVRETWFFREQAAFELLRQRCQARAGREPPFRVLSVPCATGEEPYSIAISLLHAGVRPSAFEVQAADVSARALEVAREGVYGKNSFRNPSNEHAAYFESTSAGKRVTAPVREQVQFSHGNVLDPWLHSGRQFDAVFCRNLLIYLDAESRLVALRNLTRLMHPEAVLFGGHSEALELMSFGLQRVGEAGSFAFALPSSGSASRDPKPSAGRARMPPPAFGQQAAKRHAPRPASGSQQRAEPQSVAGRLEDARSLADRGELISARARCEESLAATPSADGYCLLGIIKTAAGDLSGALDAFNKALYLDAAHYDALVHLALLCDNTGDRAAADKLRGRAERAALRTARKEDA